MSTEETQVFNDSDFDTVVETKNGILDIDVKEIWKYKDLMLLFVKRNFISQYKQTILGPAWAVVQPLLTTVVFTIFFGNVAGLAPGGVNSFVYYLCGNIFWQYFSSSMSMVSHTFTSNSNIFGKVYFPRLVLPISTVMTNLISLGIQFCFFIIAWTVFMFIPGYTMHPNWTIALLPLVIIQLALLALGCGIIISALTTKYRDLAMLVSFGVQLWMYASPVAYPASLFNGGILEKIYWCNPMCPAIELIRSSFLGNGVASFKPEFWGISWIVTLIILTIGVLLFNKVEKTFMDTV